MCKWQHLLHDFSVLTMCYYSLHKGNSRGVNCSSGKMVAFVVYLGDICQYSYSGGDFIVLIVS